MKNKILVTGATGNIGKELVKKLKERNADFIAGVTKGETIEGIETIEFDFADISSIKNAMKGVTTLFLLLPSHYDLVKFGQNAIDAALEMGIEHIVRSSGCFANSKSDLIIDKLLGTVDDNVIKSGINYTITGPSVFMQNFATMFADKYRSGMFYQSTGEGLMSFVDTRDIAAVNVEILLNTEIYVNQTLMITGSESFSYEEAIRRMDQILNKQTKYIEVSNEMAAQAMIDMHFPQFIVDLLVSLNSSIKQGHFAKTSKTVEEVTGKKPITFKQFIEDNKSVWL